MRFPLRGPQVLIYPIVVTPTKFPRIAQIAASLKLSPNTKVPIDPTMILFVAKLMLNHKSIMCSDVDDVTGSLSSKGTGSIPLGSTAFKLVIHRWNLVFGLGSWKVSLMGSFEELLVSSCWLILCREGDPWIFSISSGRILVFCVVELCSLKKVILSRYFPQESGPACQNMCSSARQIIHTRLSPCVYLGDVYTATRLGKWRKLVSRRSG